MSNPSLRAHAAREQSSGGGERLRFARFIYVVAAGAALAGCATTRYSTIYCLSKDTQLPAEPERIHDKLTGDADKDTRVLAGGLIRWEAYGRGLHDILEGCREPAH